MTESDEIGDLWLHFGANDVAPALLTVYGAKIALDSKPLATLVKAFGHGDNSFCEPARTLPLTGCAANHKRKPAERRVFFGLKQK